MAPDRISIACPHCDVVMKIRDEFAGKSIRCKNCRDVFRVPVHCERVCPGCRETLRFRSVYLNYTVACRKCGTQFWLDPIDRQAGSERPMSLGSSSEWPAPSTPMATAVPAGSAADDAIVNDLKRQLDDARKAVASRDHDIATLRGRIHAFEEERTDLANRHGKSQSPPPPPIDAEGTLLDADLLTVPILPEPGRSAPPVEHRPDEWRAELETIRRNFEAERQALTDQADSLRATLDHNRAEHDRERAQIREWINQTKAQFGAEKEALEDQLRQSQAEADNLQQQLADIESARHETDRLIEAQRGEIATLMASARDAGADRDEHDRERSRLREQIAQAEAQFGAEKETLEDQLRQSQAEADNLQQQLADIESARHETDRLIEAQRGEIATLMASARDAGADRDAQVARLSGRLAEAEAMAVVVSDLRRQIDALTGRLEAADRDRQDLVDRHESERIDQDRSHDEIVRRLERQRDEARQALAARDRERDDLLGRLDQLESGQSELLQARSRIQEAEESRESISKEAQQLREQIAGLETDRMALTKLGDTLRGQLETLQTDRLARGSEPATAEAGWRVRTRLWETEREGQQAEVEELRARVIELEADRDRLRRQGESLSAEKAAWQADRQAIRQRLSDAEAEAARLRTEAEALAEAAQTASPNGSHGNAGLDRDLALLEIERERLEAELEQAQATIASLRDEQAAKAASLPQFDDDDDDGFGRFLPPESPRIAQLEQELQSSRATVEHLRSQLFGLGINVTDGF